MTITGIANIMLGASDLDRSRTFYRDKLGLAVKQEIPRLRIPGDRTGHALPQHGARQTRRAAGSPGSGAGGGERGRRLHGA